MVASIYHFPPLFFVIFVVNDVLDTILDTFLSDVRGVIINIAHNNNFDVVSDVSLNVILVVVYFGHNE